MDSRLDAAMTACESSGCFQEATAKVTVETKRGPRQSLLCQVHLDRTLRIAAGRNVEVRDNRPTPP